MTGVLSEVTVTAYHPSFTFVIKFNILRALKTGMKSPLIITTPHEDYANAELVSLLGALHPIYVPLNIRDEDENHRPKVERVGLFTIGDNGPNIVQLASAIHAAWLVLLF